jgi:hypothetical protein
LSALPGRATLPPTRGVDSVHISNGKEKGQGNVKHGNDYLAWAFVEAVNSAHRYCDEARRFYERKKAKTNGHRRNQGAGAQTGARLLTHAQGTKALRSNRGYVSDWRSGVGATAVMLAQQITACLTTGPS